ncbi:hypothetical protein [Pinisolibacter sp.]|mgnify:CR=1 FL=1|uniref:hypothetical protein n=1 Tax=Pinisolibacter sp. TaxID=2172024 RepID=UPI002FDCC730
MTRTRFRLEAPIGHKIDIRDAKWNNVEETYGHILRDDVRKDLASATCKYVGRRHVEVIPRMPTKRDGESESVGEGEYIRKVLRSMLDSIKAFNNTEKVSRSIFRSKRPSFYKKVVNDKKWNNDADKRVEIELNDKIKEGRTLRDDTGCVLTCDEYKVFAKEREINNEASRLTQLLVDEYKGAYRIAAEILSNRLSLKGVQFSTEQFHLIEFEIKRTINNLEANPSEYGAKPGEAWENWVLSIRSILQKYKLPNGSSGRNTVRIGNLDKICYILSENFVPSHLRQHSPSLETFAYAVSQIVKADNKARAKEGRDIASGEKSAKSR